jgi:hypothetical protein
LNETSGTTAVEQIDSPNQDGTYARDVSMMGTSTGILGDDTAPVFDGANDYVNIYSATFAGAFDSGEGTISSWIQVDNAGVWTDGSNRRFFSLRTDASNRLFGLKTNTNGRFDRYYVAGGTAETRADIGYSNTDWFHIVITWSVTADEVNYYLDGALQETDTGLGAWVGALASSTTLIGAADQTPTSVWDGQLAHIAVWDRALEPDEIAGLADVNTWAIASHLGHCQQ